MRRASRDEKQAISPVTVMLTVSIVSWLALLAFVGRRTAVDLLLGMLGPLAAATISWVLTERTFRRVPDRVTALMVAAFAGKMVFFGVYVAVMLRVLGLRPAPFVASFTSYFIALYLIEAICLQRLFMNHRDQRVPRDHPVQRGHQNHDDHDDHGGHEGSGDT